MRHISILALVLFFSISANAALIIGFNGVIGPLETPELDPLQTANISIATNEVIDTPGWYVLGVPQGEPGTIYANDPWLHPDLVIGPELPFPGFSSWVIFSYESLSPIPPGLLVDNITFHCDGPGNVNMLLLGTQDFADWVTLDSQAIRQTPEPATIALLGLGAMLLKRRR